MQFNVQFGYLAVFAIFVLLIGASVHAATASDTVTVNVNISSTGAITVLPTIISWNSTTALGSLAPGADGSPQTIVIKNTGSLNVSSIYLNASTISDENSNPLGSSTASSYSAAGLIFVKNSTDSANYHAGRLEWNLSSVLTGETLNLAAATANFSHGWYRNATGNQFLWKLENGTGGFCNNTGTTFTIMTAPENATSPLVRDFSSDDTTTCVSIAAGTNWGAIECNDGPLNGHCVATNKNCDRIYIYRYNYASDFPACDNRRYLREANLIPGAEEAITIFASVPQGMPAGDTATGTLTIIATY